MKLFPVFEQNGWTYSWYKVFRVLFGLYLAMHFGMLIPWGAELFSNVGVIANASMSPLIHAFPNILAWFDSPVMVMCLLGSATVISVMFGIGIYDRVGALVLWYILACLLGRNPLIANPSLPYVGWMLLAHSFIPKRTPSTWRMPESIYIVAWVLLAVGYTYSGLTKLSSPSWVDGTALLRLLENPLSRSGWIRDFILMFPSIMLSFATWGALALEILFAPLAFIRGLRPYLWCGMLSMHLGLLCLVNFADLSCGMLLIHAFTFDPRWLNLSARDPETDHLNLEQKGDQVSLI